MILTKDITSGANNPPIQSAKQGDENQNLLDLSPSDVVFYVGGYPANFTVSKSELKKKKKKGQCRRNVSPCLTSCGFNALLCLLLFLFSLQILSNFPCTMAASSSSPLMIKPSVFTTSAPGTRSTCRLRAKGDLTPCWLGPF